MDITVSELASDVGIPDDLLLKQLAEAGLKKINGDDIITEHEKRVLLTHLRASHGKGKKRIPTPNRQGKQSKENSLLSANNSESVVNIEHASTELEAPPKVFISYSYDSPEHIIWVEQLATMLRTDGVDALLDRWNIHLGDPITEFMERGIRESDFVLIICTEIYKKKSDSRLGGVGYEEAIISSEILSISNHRKYIPILKTPKATTAIPTALHSKRYLDLSSEKMFDDSYRDLLITLFGRLPVAPPIGKPPGFVYS